MLELNILKAWIDSGDRDMLLKYSVHKEWFEGIHGEIYEFIDNYYVKYSVAPQLYTVQEKFPEFEPSLIIEPMEYLSSNFKSKAMANNFSKDVDYLIESMSRVDTAESRCELLKVFTEHYSEKYATSNLVGGGVDMGSVIKEYQDTVDDFQEMGFLSGIKGLDEATKGWLSDDLILLTARVNEGKSYMGLYFTYKVWKQLQEAQDPRPILIVSTEMLSDEVMCRFITLDAHFPNSAVRSRSLPQRQDLFEYMDKFKENFGKSVIFIDAKTLGFGDFTLQKIANAIRVYNPAWVFIDQIYDINGADKKATIREGIVNSFGELRKLNQNVTIPFMIVAQTGRAAVTGPKDSLEEVPELHHVQESDGPAQKSTKVLTMRQTGPNTVKIGLKKNRGKSKNVTFLLDVDFEHGHIVEVDFREENF
jgi:replicative DNA helicase